MEMTKTKGSTKMTPPSNLVLRLFDPGMSMLHRAGLGGLACTLRALKHEYIIGSLRENDIPGAPWPEDTPPWTIEPLQINLNFGEPDNAAEFLKRLFAYAFQIRDGFIYLPGQYGNGTVPNQQVRAEMQKGLVLTFLQFGPHRDMDKTDSILNIEIDEKIIQFTNRQCTGFKHQMAWQDLCSKSQLKEKTIEIIGLLHPGAIIRHNAFAAQTKIEESSSRTLALYFALVGCLALPIQQRCGALLVPEVMNLINFMGTRPYMTPTTVKECKITNASDAALQAQVRLLAKRLIAVQEIPACYATTFQSTKWSTKQKSRVKTIHVPAGDEDRLLRFEHAYHILAPHPVPRTLKETQGKGKNKVVIEKQEWFLSKSVVLPLVSENLALNRPWYQGFAELMTKQDPINNRPLRDRVRYEQKGLNAMMEKIPWEDRGESTVVKAVHEAIGRRYGMIADENKLNPVAMKKRWTGEYDRWRLAFSGSKTPEQFRHSLCDLFSRAGVNSVLKNEWKTILPMLDDRRWPLTRDLALLALASYAGKGADVIEQTQSTEEGEA